MGTTALLCLHAQTDIHPGSGEAGGNVDMAIQRESHTQWPTIYSTSLKGVLRDCFQTKNIDSDTIAHLFGVNRAEPNPDNHHAGALLFSDAQILAFPVRADPGVFAWVTCETVVNRLLRELNHHQLQLNNLQKLEPIQNRMEARVTPKGGALVANVHGVNRLGLRDLLLHVAPPGAEQTEQESPQGLIGFAEWLATHACDTSSDSSTNVFDPRNRLVQVSDDVFTYLVRHATHVVTRNTLDSDSRTVVRGALFSQELLPPEALFYSIVVAQNSRKPNPKPLEAPEVMERFRAQAHGAALQIGADETTGKGVCLARLY